MFVAAPNEEDKLDKCNSALAILELLHSKVGSVDVVLDGDKDGELDKARLFICIGACWDTLLSEEVSSATRMANARSLKATVQSAVPKTFPAALLQLLDKWVDGMQVSAALP
jgi:hypothetical protein